MATRVEKSIDGCQMLLNQLVTYQLGKYPETSDEDRATVTETESAMALSTIKVMFADSEVFVEEDEGFGVVGFLNVDFNQQKNLSMRRAYMQTIAILPEDNESAKRTLTSIYVSALDSLRAPIAVATKQKQEHRNQPDEQFVMDAMRKAGASQLCSGVAIDRNNGQSANISIFARNCDEDWS